MVVSSVVSVESPPVSPSGFSADHEEKGAQEDIRQDAQLRKRAWSFEWDEEQQMSNMPGTLTSLGKTTVDSIECVRSCDQTPYLHNETKGGICIKIEFNPQKNISLLQHGRHFFVYSFNMAAVTSCEHTL